MIYDQDDETWGAEKRGEDVIPDVIPSPQRNSDWLSLPGLNAGNFVQ